MSDTTVEDPGHFWSPFDPYPHVPSPGCACYPVRVSTEDYEGLFFGVLHRSGGPGGEVYRIPRVQLCGNEPSATWKAVQDPAHPAYPCTRKAGHYGPCHFQVIPPRTVECCADHGPGGAGAGGASGSHPDGQHQSSGT